MKIFFFIQLTVLRGIFVFKILWYLYSYSYLAIKMKSRSKEQEQTTVTVRGGGITCLCIWWMCSKTFNFDCLYVNNKFIYFKYRYTLSLKVCRFLTWNFVIVWIHIYKKLFSWKKNQVVKLLQSVSDLVILIKGITCI